MSRRAAWRWGAAALALLAILAAAELFSGSGGGRRVAPPLPSRVLSPPRLTLAQLHGEPAAIDFWASWCGPCREEASQLERLARSLHGGARLVGVDWSDDSAAARAFIQANHWTFPVLSDPSGAAGERYGLLGLPTTFVLDGSGRIVETLRGPQTVAELRAALRAA